MQKYALVEQGNLVIVRAEHPGATPVRYALVPEYDQLTQRVVQLAPVDQGDHIHVGTEVQELPPQEDGEGGEF